MLLCDSDTGSVINAYYSEQCGLSWSLLLVRVQVSFSAVLRTSVLSCPSYGIFYPRSGEDSYVLVNPALIAWRSGTGRKQAHC